TYRAIYGHTVPNTPVDVVSWRVIAHGPKPTLTLPAAAPAGDARAALKGLRPAYLPEKRGYAEVPIYDRYALGGGARRAGDHRGARVDGGRPGAGADPGGRGQQHPGGAPVAVDQLTLDVLWNRLIATVNEQAAALMRSSFTSIVRESGDLSAGVFDRRGRMVAQAVTGTPGHINSMATGMIHFLERFPVDTLRPGDVLVTNDPWKTASQLNDITIATPVFRGGRVVALFANT